MKKYLGAIILIVSITPSLASAAWWNPVDWFSFFGEIFSPKEIVSTQSVPTPLPTAVATTTNTIVENKPITPKKETQKKPEVVQQTIVTTIIPPVSTNTTNTTNDSQKDQVVDLLKQQKVTQNTTPPPPAPVATPPALPVLLSLGEQQCIAQDINSFQGVRQLSEGKNTFIPFKISGSYHNGYSSIEGTSDDGHTQYKSSITWIADAPTDRYRGFFSIKIGIYNYTVKLMSDDGKVLALKTGEAVFNDCQ